MSVAWLFVAGAFAGYGDAVEGLPSRDEREMHVWTNAVRVDPEAFKDDYACSWDRFSADEQTPKAPVLWHAGLNEAARFHADDMAAHGVEDCFQHDSCDGTSFGSRLARYYPSSFVSENIAWGHPDARSAVIEGWMCSDAGHRENIMTAEWEELGTGQNGVFYVQDFGIRDIPDRAIGMGVHIENGARITYYADFYHPDRLAPGLFDVVVDGVRVPLTVEYGEAWRGVYKAQSQPGEGCHTYFFEVIAGGETTTFPEDGAYGWGPCEFDDPAAGWLAERVEAEPGETDTDTGSEVEPDTDTDTDTGSDVPADTESTGGVCGCATGNGPGSGFLLALGVLLARRRGTPRR